MVGVLQVLADKTMVVDLAVGGNGNALIGVGERLSATLCFYRQSRLVSLGIFHRSRFSFVRTNTDNTETLMAQNCVKRMVSANFVPFIQPQ